MKNAIELIRAKFHAAYGRDPAWMAVAPGRVNLIGEHTDYNGGFVLPMAIGYYTFIAAAPNNAGTIQFRSTMASEAVSVDLSQPLMPGPTGQWGNYPKGVLAGFIERGWTPPAFDALIHSTVPIGSGLSSSAALEVATATLLEAMLGRNLDPVDKALLCQRAEHEYAGVPCGIMDQFVSTLARKDHLLLLDCRDNQPSWAPMTDDAMAILIVNSNVKHSLANGEYRQRREQCEAATRALGVASLRDVSEDMLQRRASDLSPVSMQRARHVVSENGRTLQAVECVRHRDWQQLGRLMYASHESLRDDYAVSCSELDTLVEIARGIGPQGGMLGCRMTGGGFGGCVVALIEATRQQAIAQVLETEYHERTGIAANSFISRPAQGAIALAI